MDPPGLPPRPNTQMLSRPPALYGNIPPSGVPSQVPCPQSHQPALHVQHNQLQREFIVASCGLLEFHSVDKNLLSDEQLWVKNGAFTMTPSWL